MGYGYSDAHGVSDEICFYLARGWNTHAWKIRGHAREFTYPLRKVSIIAQPSIADPWALPKRNLTFTEHMAGQIKNYLQAHNVAYITYIRSARLAKSI